MYVQPLNMANKLPRDGWVEVVQADFDAYIKDNLTPHNINVIVDLDCVLNKLLFYGDQVTILHSLTYKGLMRRVTALQGNPKAFFISVPRLSRVNVNLWYHTVETIKDGFTMDLRGRDKIWDPPAVWIYTDQKPPPLPKHKYVIWTVDH